MDRIYGRVRKSGERPSSVHGTDKANSVSVDACFGSVQECSVNSVTGMDAVTNSHC